MFQHKRPQESIVCENQQRPPAWILHKWGRGVQCSTVQVRCTVGGEAAAGAGLLWSTLLSNTFNQAGHRCIVQWGEKTVLQVRAPNMIVSWASSPICTVLYWSWENIGRHTYSVVLKFFVERTDFTKSLMSTKKQLNIIVNKKQRTWNFNFLYLFQMQNSIL